MSANGATGVTALWQVDGLCSPVLVSQCTTRTGYTMVVVGLILGALKARHCSRLAIDSTLLSAALFIFKNANTSNYQHNITNAHVSLSSFLCEWSLNRISTPSLNNCTVLYITLFNS